MHNQGQRHSGGGGGGGRGGATAPPILLLGGRCPPKHRGYVLSTMRCEESVHIIIRTCTYIEVNVTNHHAYERCIQTIVSWPCSEAM